jgi:hypothetical protein
MKWAELSRVAEPAGLSGWQYEFMLPADRIGLPKRYTDSITGPDATYSRLMVNGNRVHTDVAQLYARYAFVPAPADWPAVFRKAHAEAMASDLAAAIPNNFKLSDSLRDLICWCTAVSLVMLFYGLNNLLAMLHLPTHAVLTKCISHVPL